MCENAANGSFGVDVKNVYDGKRLVLQQFYIQFHEYTIKTTDLFLFRLFQCSTDGQLYCRYRRQGG